MVPKEPTQAQADLLARLGEAGVVGDPLVEEAMLDVPRDLFVPDDLKDMAYEDQPLPVGHGQTISAPHMVAMMTTALDIKRGSHVLEVGTGLGYHAAVLKAVVGDEGRVTSIEFMPELAKIARTNLANAGFAVDVRDGDGYLGAEDLAPFDSILITCAIPRIPDVLLNQLRDGGHVVAPIGHTDCALVVGRRSGKTLDIEELGQCRFVNAQGQLAEWPAKPLA
jgi:protein-L-isoaspartate(D-aspartate) O-methyltransferase